MEPASIAIGAVVSLILLVAIWVVKDLLWAIKLNDTVRVTGMTFFSGICALMMYLYFAQVVFGDAGL